MTLNLEKSTEEMERYKMAAAELEMRELINQERELIDMADEEAYMRACDEIRKAEEYERQQIKFEYDKQMEAAFTHFINRAIEFTICKSGHVPFCVLTPTTVPN